MGEGVREVFNKTFKWEYVTLVALITLGVLSLAYFSYETLGIRRPLVAAISNDPDVLSAEISQENGKTVIAVRLRQVHDLSETYKRIESTAEKYVSRDCLEIKVIDHRNEALEEIYMKVHYYLEEAAARGDYGSMIDSARPILDSSGLTGWHVMVDNGDIFVQLYAGPNYLYQVIPAAWARGGNGM